MNARDFALIAFLAIVAYLALSALALGPTFLPAITGSDHFILAEGVGSSMLPTIHDGDYLVIDTTPESIELGDIIVYKHNNELIGHRVIKITSEGYIVKGDNNPAPDPWIVRPEDVIGEVEWVIHDQILKIIAELWFERYA